MSGANLETSKIKKPPVPKPEVFPTLSATDVCAIIKECGQSGVRELKFYGLNLSFGNLVAAQAIEPVIVPHETQKKSDSQAREAIERRELELKDEFVQDLLVSDPQEYERLLRNEELVDDGQEESEERD